MRSTMWQATKRGLARPGAVQAAVIGMVAAGVSFWLRTLPIVSDPFNYVLAGRTFPEITWNMVGLTRYGIIFPLVPITRLFHDSELSFYLTPVIATAILMACTHWLTARFFGFTAGVAAVVTTLACSPVLINATRLYPDIFAASSTVLAVALAVATRDATTRGAGTARVALLLAGTGLAVGASWWMRETTVFAWPVVTVILLWRGGPSRRLIVLVAGSTAAAMFVAEMVVSKLAFGDWLARVHALTAVDMASTTNAQDLPYLNQGRLSYVWMVPRVMLQQPDGVVMLLEGILAVLGALLLRRAVMLFAGWFICCLVLLIAFGGALDPASPSIRLDLVRYWLLFLVPMIIAAVGAVTTVVRAAAPTAHVWWRRTRRRGGVATAIVAAGLLLAPVIPTANWARHNPQFVVANGGVMDEFRDWIRQHDEVGVLWADLATQRQLPTFTRTFSGRPLAQVRFKRFTAQTPPPPGSYVILFSEGRPTCGFCAEWIAEFFSAHPQVRSRWTPVWASADGTFKVYRVDGRWSRG